MKVSLTSVNYLRENIRSVKKGKECDLLFFNKNNKIFASMRKDYNGESRYFSTDIFKDGKAFIHKFVKQTFFKICSAGATVEEDKPVVNRIITTIIENNHEDNTKRTIKKVVDLETPHKLMEEYPAYAKIYKLDGEIKYSKPNIIEDKTEILRKPKGKQKIYLDK